MATAFRPEERTVPADYDAVPSGLVDRVIAGAARGEVDEGDLRRVERVAEKLLPMRLAPEQDEEVSPEELLKVAEFLQLALEFEMYNHDKKEDDLEDAYKTVEDLRSDLKDLRKQSEGSGAADLSRKVEDLTIKMEGWKEKATEREKQLKFANDSLEEEKSKSTRLELELKDAEKRIQEAQNKVSDLQDELVERMEENAKELKRRDRSAQDNIGEKMDARNREMSRFQRENKFLEKRLLELQEELQEAKRIGLESDEHLLNLAEAKRQWVMREGELDARVEELEMERDELLDRTEELSAMVDDEKSLLEQFEANFKKEYKEWEDQLAAKDAELLERMEQNELLLLKINRLNSDLGDGDHQDTLVGLTSGSAGTGTPAEAEALRAELKVVNEKAVVLADAYCALEQDTAREVEAALDKQRVRLARLEEDNVKLRAALANDKKSEARLEKMLSHAQADLEESEKRRADYEAGVFGLPEAMRDVKRLKRELRAAEERQQQGIRKINDLSEQMEKLLEEHNFMRETFGQPTEQELGDFKMKRQIEQQSLRALNSQLEAEVRALEEERRKLRSELRYRAKWHGEAAAKLGLTNNQLMMLEDFSDELKFGEGSGVEDQLIANLEGEVQSLKAKLADALMGTWSGRAMLEDGEDMASLSSLQKQLALSKVDAATLQEEVVAARQANERLIAENHRIAEKVVSNLERLSGELTEETAQQLMRTMQTLRAAMADPSVAPLGGLATGTMQPIQLSPELIAQLGTQASGGGGAAAAPSAEATAAGGAAVLELAAALEAMRKERDQYKAAAADGGGGGGGDVDVKASVLGLGVKSGAAAAARGGGGTARMAKDIAGTEEYLDRHALEVQLLECLHEQSKKDERLGQLADEVERYKSLLQQSGDVRSMLYRDHLRLRGEWRAEQARLAAATRTAQGEAKEATLALQATRQLVEKLRSGSQEELKTALVKASNDLTLTRVREIRLVRTLDVTRAAESANQAEARDAMGAYEALLVATDRQAGELRAARDAAEALVKQQGQQLELSVRREAYEKVLEASRVMQAKYMALMQETTDEAVKEVNATKALEDNRRLKAENKSLREETALFRTKVEAYEETLHGSGGETAADQRAALVQLRVELASALRQQEYDSKERKRLEEGKGELESKLKEVEVKLANMSTALHAAQEAEASQLQRLTTAVSMSQYRLDADATSALHARVAEAEAAAAAATQKAAAAEAEAAKVAADRHVRTLELNTMRDALRSMEATSDNKAALGKLHEEVLRLRAREVTLKHSLARTEAHNDRLEAEGARLLRRCNERDAAFHSAHRELRELLQEHEQALSRSELLLRGRINPTKAAEWSSAVLELRLRCKSYQADTASARQAAGEAQDRATAAEARAEQAAHAAKLHRGDVKLSDVAAHNLQLSEKVLQLKLAESRLMREAHLLNEKAHFLQKVDEEREASTQKMEEEALRTRADHESQLEELTRRVRTLQGELLEARRVAAERAAAEREGAKETAASTRVAVNARRLLTSDQPKLVAQINADRAQIEEARETIMLQLDSISTLKLEKQEATHRAECLASEVAALKEQASLAEHALTQLQRRAESWGVVKDGNEHSAAEDLAVAQVTAVAQASVKRMQVRLEEKDAELKAAALALSKSRQDAMAQHNADMAELARLNDALYSKKLQSIDQLRDGYNAPAQPAAAESNPKHAGKQSYQELLDVLQQRERELLTLKSKQDSVKSKADQMQSRLEDALTAKNQEMDRLMKELDRERTKGPSMMMESLVSKLKVQLAGKDKKLSQLKEAIRQLEARLIDAMKATATGDMNLSQVRSVEAQAAQADSLNEQLESLKEKLAAVKAEGAKSRAAAEAKGRDAARLAVDLARSEAAAKAMAAELARVRKKAGPPPREPTKSAVSVDSPKVEQLEKRIAVLTSQNQKLSKMLKAEGHAIPTMSEQQMAMEAEIAEKSRTIIKLERQLEKASQPARGQAKGASLLSGNAGLEQWEAGKALQKKVDGLRKRLDEKTKELEQSEKVTKQLRADLAQALSDKERLRSGRARAAAAAAGADGTTPETKKTRGAALEAEVLKLNRQLLGVEAENDRLQRTVHVAQAQQILKLEAQVAELKTAGVSAVPRSGGAAAEEAVRAAEARALDAQAAALELRFDKEQAALKARRLEDRLQLLIDRADSGLPEGVSAAGAGKPSPTAKRVTELEDVVEALKRVVEKLKGENDALRKGATTNTKYMAAVSKVKELKATVEALQAEAAARESDEATKRALRERCASAEAEAAGLKKQLSKTEARAATGAAAVAETETLRKELDAKAKIVRALQRQMEEYATSAASQTHSVSAARSESNKLQTALTDVTRQLAAATAENRDLKNELNAFDPAFFDEIEDLKLSHHTLSSACGRYEELLRTYTARLGLDFQPLR